MPPCHLWNAARAVCQVKSHKVALIKSVDFSTTLLTPRPQSGDWRPSTWRRRACVFSVRTTHAMSGYGESVRLLEDVNDTHPLTLFKRLAIYCRRFHLEGLPSRRVAVWAFISILVTISLVTITMATVSEACSFCILKCWAAAEWKERWGKKT